MQPLQNLSGTNNPVVSALLILSIMCSPRWCPPCIAPVRRIANETDSASPIPKLIAPHVKAPPITAALQKSPTLGGFYQPPVRGLFGFVSLLSDFRLLKREHTLFDVLETCSRFAAYPPIRSKIALMRLFWTKRPTERTATETSYGTLEIRQPWLCSDHPKILPMRGLAVLLVRADRVSGELAFAPIPADMAVETIEPL